MDGVGGLDGLAMAVHHRGGAGDHPLRSWCSFYLTDRPADAAWLAPDERAWLADRLDAEDVSARRRSDFSVGRPSFNPRVLGAGLVYFGAVATNYGVGFCLPQIVKAFGAVELP